MREQVTGIEMSATGSRSVRKTVLSPGRRLTCATWPSTHTAPSRSIQPSISVGDLADGRRRLGEVSRAMGGPRLSAKDGPHPPP